MEKKHIIRKICLLGDGGVGKTSLISRYVLNSYSDEYVKSIGTRVSKKVMDYDGLLTLMIWDVLGRSPRSRCMQHIIEANGVLLVCDNARGDAAAPSIVEKGPGGCHRPHTSGRHREQGGPGERL